MVNPRVLLPALVVAVGIPVAARQNPPAQPAGADTSAKAADPQRPVFRTGAHYVRVDAYPTGKDGHIVQGLTRDDFEIFEDGKPQTIENSEYVTFDTWTPEGERKDPRTQQDAYDLLADPTWRVFVIVIDRGAYDMRGQYYMRTPLHDFLERNLGPRDLFGLLTTASKWTDLVLGQKTTAADGVIDNQKWLFADDFDEIHQMYEQCGMTELLSRRRLDDTYSLLEGLVRLLGLVREEKKSIVFVANGLATPGPARNTQSAGSTSGVPGLPPIPGIPANPGRPITPGPRLRPPTSGGPGSGPSGPTAHGDRIVTPSREANCSAERMRVADIDFAQRFFDLLRDARRGNVAFYPISPMGLQAVPFKPEGGVDMAAYHATNARLDTLRSLASETDGVAIVDTNDLAGGMRRIAGDIQAYYVLGYYSTNTNWDGGIRKITVRLKPKKNTIRARRQYRAPTLAEINALSSPSARPAVAPTAEAIALSAFARVRPGAPFMSYAAPAGADLALLLEVPRGEGAWPAGTEVSVIAESADEDVVGWVRETLKSPGHVALVHVPLDGRKPAALGMVKVRMDGMIYTDKVKVPAPTSLVGDPLQFRNGALTVTLSCARTDAVRLEWPVLAAAETRAARLLDRDGRELKVPVALSERDRRLIADITLAPLARGDYLVELIVSSGSVRERKLTPVRIQ